MSRVTDFIINLSICESEKFHKHMEDFKGMKLVTAPVHEYNWYTGNKVCQSQLIIGAYNYLLLDEMLAHMKKYSFEYPEDVQVFAKSEEQNRYTEVWEEYQRSGVLGDY